MIQWTWTGGLVKEVVLWLLWGHVRLPNSGYGINEINTNKQRHGAVHVEALAFCAARTGQEMTTPITGKPIAGGMFKAKRGTNLPTQILKPFSVLRSFKGPEERQFFCQLQTPLSNVVNALFFFRKARSSEQSKHVAPKFKREVCWIHPLWRVSHSNMFEHQNVLDWNSTSFSFHAKRLFRGSFNTTSTSKWLFGFRADSTAKEKNCSSALWYQIFCIVCFSVSAISQTHFALGAFFQTEHKLGMPLGEVLERFCSNMMTMS